MNKNLTIIHRRCSPMSMDNKQKWQLSEEEKNRIKNVCACIEKNTYLVKWVKKMGSQKDEDKCFGTADIHLNKESLDYLVDSKRRSLIDKRVMLVEFERIIFDFVLKEKLLSHTLEQFYYSSFFALPSLINKGVSEYQQRVFLKKFLNKRKEK